MSKSVDTNEDTETTTGPTEEREDVSVKIDPRQNRRDLAHHETDLEETRNK